MVATDSSIQVVESYSGVLSILFALDDEITSGSGDVQLGDDVRALSALSAAEDQASQQRAILYGALVASALNNATRSSGSSFNNVGGATALNDFGGLAAFVAAQDLQFADQQSFDAVASQAQSTAVTDVPGQPGVRGRAADREPGEHGRRPDGHLPACHRESEARLHRHGRLAGRLVLRHVGDHRRDAERSTTSWPARS